MKTYSKSIFLTMLILFLLIFLSGCLPGLTPTSPKGVISGRVMVPSSETAKDITGWVPAANATVTLIDSEGVTHTVTTDEDGYYSFGNVTVNTNTIITATATIDGNTVVMKDVVSQAVDAIEDYDAGTMNVESTALGLIVEELIEQGLTSEDINLQEIQASDNFAEVVEQVSSVLEENGNVTTDPDVSEMVNDAAEEIINPPAPTPTTPSPVLVSAITVTGNNTVVNGQTLQLGITVTPDNATNKTVTWSVVPGTGAATISASGLLTATEIGTVSVKAVAQDGSLKEGTKAITVTAPVVAAASVSLNKTTTNIVAGATETLVATVLPADATNKTVTWVSDNAAATVDNAGVVTGVSAGTAIITATTVDGSFTATCTITVTPVFNGNVTGIITSDASGIITGTLTGDYALSITGQFTSQNGNMMTFTGTVSGDINGTITGGVNANGIDTMAGFITGTGAVLPVRILGVFLQSGTNGDFSGQIITGPEPTYVDSMTITSAGDATTVVAGDTLQLDVSVLPTEASEDVVWSVYVNDTAVGSISETGLLSGLTPGSVTVIAKALDGSLKDAVRTFTVVE